MKLAWELRFRDNRQTAVISGTAILMMHVFIYAFFSQADPEFATLFSRSFGLSADLGKCSPSFSTIVMSQMVYSIVFALLLMLAAGKSAFAAITDVENRKSFLWIVGGSLLLAGFLIGLATTDHGWWLSSWGRRSFISRTTFPEACLNSSRSFSPLLYLISLWLAVLTWIALAAILGCMRTLKFRIQYDDLPLDPQLREEILEIRAKYPPLPTPKTANRWQAYLGFILIVGGCVAGLWHGLYKVGTAVMLLASGN